jgi:hypothetical protein
MSEAETDDSSTRIVAMSGDLGPSPDTTAPEFEASRFQYGALVLLVVAILAYGGSLLLPKLFKSAASTTDAAVTGETSPAALPPPQPRCHLGFGACDWAGLHSPRPRCHNGVGACDWTGLNSPPPRCHYGVGACDWGRTSPNQGSGDSCDIVSGRSVQTLCR